ERTRPPVSYPPTPGPLPEHRPPAEPAPPPYSSPYQQTGAYQQTGYQHGVDQHGVYQHGVYQHGVDQHGVDQPAPQPGQYPPLGGYPGAMSEVRYAELTVSRPAEVTAAFWVWVVGTVLWPGGASLAA